MRPPEIEPREGLGPVARMVIVGVAALVGLCAVTFALAFAAHAGWGLAP